MSEIYATFRADGRQYRVKSGDNIVMNRLAAAVGDSVNLGGAILVEGENGDIRTGADAAKCTLSATVAENFLGKKLRVFKMRRRKASRRTAGHRQQLTRLVIGDIRAD